MINKLKRFLKTDLFKTSFWNGVATVFKMGAGLITNKIIAVYLGPGGIAIMGQFRNFTEMVMSFSLLGVNTGVTKYIAESRDDIDTRNKYLSTGFYITLVGTIIAGLVVFFGRGYFGRNILHTEEYSSIFIVFSLTLILFSLNSFFIGVFNGFKQFKIIIARNILGSLLSLIMALVLVIEFGLYGALLGVILSQSLIFFVLTGVLLRSDWFSFKTFFKNFNFKKIIKFSNFTIMALVTSIFVTYIQLLIRNYIINNLSANEAGFWEGMIRISNIFAMVFTTTLSLYYLPRFSEIKSYGELKVEIFKGYKFIIPLLLISGATMFFLRKFVVELLYSKEFYPMIPLFLFQIIGDILKISSWLLSYNLLAKAKTLFFVLTEITFGISLYGFTLFFVNTFGVIGTTYAYALNYFIYLIIMVLMFRKLFRN